MIRAGLPNGRNDTAYETAVTFTSLTTLIFAVPDYYLPDNGGGVSVLISPVTTPGLSIKLTGTNTALVYWPSPSTGFNLRVNTNLATTNWLAPAETFTDDGTIKYLLVNPPVGNRFYPLQNPCGSGSGVGAALETIFQPALLSSTTT